MNCSSTHLTFDPTRVMFLTWQQPDSTAAALNKFCSICTPNGVYTEFGIDQALHKSDQPLLVHGVLIDHKTDLALTADRRNHIDPLPLRLHRQHWRTALGRKATFNDLTVAYASLIGPIDYGILRLRTP